jgi:hypothetical protein
MFYGGSTNSILGTGTDKTNIDWRNRTDGHNFGYIAASSDNLNCFTDKESSLNMFGVNFPTMYSNGLQQLPNPTA